ncbi:MAG: prepilin-type N-terminal cleavage/methylation domain-containing protein [Sulfurihydrogenibium sp.]|uniref:prepilin-type N-terminal cleavage/methylation domain-containing protein n=1 Tax=Sulfurihydrogenibium sp. TaxID=2053621 RepID=UPI003D10A368
MQLNNKKAFTIVELLIASIIILLVSIGLLRGILFYIQYSTAQKMKDLASQINTNFVKYFDTLPYSQINPVTYPNGWDFSSCDNTTGNCTFTNQDTDGDNIPDFYDPYNGDNNNQYSNPLSNFGSWLAIRPNQDGTCDTGGQNFPNIPPCIVALRNNPNFRVYTAVTMARVANASLESGKAVGVVTWYFDPITKKYKSVHTILFKGRE